MIIPGTGTGWDQCLHAELRVSRFQAVASGFARRCVNIC